jgi:Calcineurin-like phosphoesterase
VTQIYDAMLIISDKYKKKARSFYEKVSQNFNFVISTMGNHEFYHGLINYAYPCYQSQIAENHLKLNNRSYVIDNVKFIVTTLWSHVPEVSRAEVRQGLNDYNLIQYADIYKDKYLITVEHTNRYHKHSLRFIKDELKKPFSGSIVIMTHHVPSYDCITDKYKDSKLNSAFVTDLNYLIEGNPQIKYWVCGHSHDFNETKIGNTMVIRNPLGYLECGEEVDFQRDYTIEI